ncbi:kelch-like protein 15 [Tubulanus polymorphus]|uniref:kelch-like protein 15 n=1 Tax=Tubulanus polymorphus TaxID=672921 RepID=UPI003DA40D39
MARQTFLRIGENIELIKVSDEKHKYINPQYKKIRQVMYDYTCDILLKVEEETFRAHREVLSEASDYFAAMFSVDMKEKDQEAIELYEISPVGFTNLLHYFYHGYITLDTANIEDILEAARFFHVEWLLEIACDFLVRHLSIENYYSVLHLADKYCLGDLSEDIFKHIGEHFLILSSQPKFLMLSFELLHQLLSNDYYIAASEKCILQVILKWVDHEEEARKKHIVPLFKEIRFALLDHEDIVNLPAQITENEELQEVIGKALEYAANPFIQCLVEPSHASARGSRPVIGLMSGDEEIEAISYKVPGRETCYEQPMLTGMLYTDAEYASVATLGNFVFLVGGYDGEYNSSDLVYRFDPRNSTWIDIASMNEPRVGFGLCNTENALYAMCGVFHVITDNILNDQDTYLCTAEKYVPEGNRWEYIPSVPYNCYDLAATACNNNIYITGGITDNPEDEVPVNYNLRYVPGEDSWTHMEPMLSSRSSHTMVTHNEKIYVFGGCTTANMTVMECRTNECYDIMTNQWTQIRSSPRSFGRFQRTVAVLDNCFYLLGGMVGMRYLFEYDIESDTFSSKQCGLDFHKVVSLRVGLPETEEESV